MKKCLASQDFPWRLGDKAHQCKHAHTLAATALTNDPKSFPFRQVIIDPVDGVKDPFARLELNSEVSNLQKRGHLLNRKGPWAFNAGT